MLSLYIILRVYFEYVKYEGAASTRSTDGRNTASTGSMSSTYGRNTASARGTSSTQLRVQAVHAAETSETLQVIKRMSSIERRNTEVYE